MNVKAITICQPYAHLICLPDDHPRAKRVENRTWGTSYRGDLLIHAGKSRKFLTSAYGIAEHEMVFGAIVGIAKLADCVSVGQLKYQVGTIEIGIAKFNGLQGSQRVLPEASRRRWPWLESHEHTEGPYCFVLTEVRRFESPIPYRGAQGFFDVPKDVVEGALATV